MKKDCRGFRYFGEVKHTYGGKVTIKESSALGRFCWIFIDNDGESLAQNDAAHLNVAQAKRVVKALQRFIDGE